MLINRLVTSTLSLLLIAVSSFAFAVQNDKKSVMSFMDRDLWMALPQTEIDTGSESYTLTALKAHKTVKPNQRLYLWIGEPAWPNNGDAITVKGLTQSGDVWYLDTPEALFIDRSRITMRGLEGDFVTDLSEPRRKTL